jgi:phosphoribosylformylglycinamidine synthase
MPRRRFIVEVRPAPGVADREGASVLAAIREFGILSVSAARSARLYELAGPIDRDRAERAARELFADPIAETFEIEDEDTVREAVPGELTLTIVRRPGVMDPVVASARKALRDAGLWVDGLSIRTARRYRLAGAPAPAERETIERRVLANPVIEDAIEGERPLPPLPEPRPVRVERRTVPVTGGHGLAALEKANRELGLAFAPWELVAVARHFRELGRDPTDVELETIAQSWSEHCKHKTLGGAVRYRGPIPWRGGEPGEVRYQNLLGETIFQATKDLARGDFCLSVFADNAGVVAFDETRAVCMKVETHNHPSALEPYGGAGTGVGGVIRDILGTGLGAKPIAATDVFCFGPPDLPGDRVPPGALHPRQVLRGVVAGVRDYGNRMGVPTVSGGIFFDERYVANPVVYCGTVGLIPREHVSKAPRAGDAIVLVGGRTGRDGIHGATFSSQELHEESERTSSGAVQIGNPIEEKRVLDVLLAARDRGLLDAVTDCGAGGLSSAVGEMAEALGAEVRLERVPLKYEGLTPAEIWISEAQERMVLAVPPERLEALLALFAAEGVEATPIGRFTGDGRLRIFHGDLEVADLDLGFVHRGLPRIEREARWEPPAAAPAPAAAAPAGRHGGERTAADDILAILASWNVCSKEAVIRQYDHEVQGTSALKPLVGAREAGPGDAAVLAPVRGSRRGVAIGCGMNPRLGEIDPFRMAQAAVDEALRNVVATGADPDRAALLDNFAWGDAQIPDRLGSLVLAAEGAARAARALGTPFVSGKDSLNNEYRAADGRRLAIPPTLLISCLAIHPDVARAVTMDAKRPGSRIYLVGRTRAELGGSHLHLVRGLAGGEVPGTDLALARRTFRALHAAIHAGLVLACHDVAEGGVAVAAAEMALAGEVGIDLDVAAFAGSPGAAEAAAAGEEALLFSESCSRFLVEVAPERAPLFEAALADIPCAPIGRTTSRPRLAVLGREGTRPPLEVPLEALAASFRGPLARALDVLVA